MSRRSGEVWQPVCHQGQKLLVYHNLFLGKTEGVLYVWLEDKTQKKVALCVPIIWRMSCGSHRQCLPAQCSNLASRITADTWPNKLTPIRAGIKEVRTNSKGLAKLGDGNRHPAQECQTAHQSAHEGSNCRNGMHCSPSSSPEFQFVTLQNKLILLP